MHCWQACGWLRCTIAAPGMACVGAKGLPSTASLAQQLLLRFQIPDTMLQASAHAFVMVLKLVYVSSSFRVEI